MGPETPIQFLPRMGPARAAHLSRLGITLAADLLWYLPRGYADRRALTRLSGLVPGALQTVIATAGHGSVRRAGSKGLFELELIDAGARATAVWWNQPYLARTLLPGVRLLLHGKVRHSAAAGFELQSPEYELLGDAASDGALHGGRIVPIYALTAGVTQKMVRGAVRCGLDLLARTLADPLPEALRAGLDLPERSAAFEAVHFPASLEAAERGRRRLAFDELLALQLALGWVKRRRGDEPRASLQLVPRADSSEATLRASLSFSLTQGQEEVLREIRRDLEGGRVMNRLLQGDVGSGKTIVSILAALWVVESGGQVAYLAPTEILAEQQARVFSRVMDPLGIECASLLGKTRASERRVLLERLGEGSLSIAIGTHALIEEVVAFRRLALVVVDEQHRFGVLQRSKLRAKGETPHSLIMSATPIPRTLAMTLYGDLDLSALEEMPPGRMPPQTRLVPPDRYQDLLQWVGTRLRAGEQAFFVYPLVEESEQLDLKDATRMWELLRAHPAFERSEVGLLHGRMKGEDKEASLADFRSGRTRALVATTVVEVGVDIPEASIMVVEHPERFGLSQLHQLRGRVGRGGGRSHFFLVQREGASRESLARLRVLVRESNGFRVAEADLALRGPGEFLGTAQHGLPPLRAGDLTRDTSLLHLANREAARILSEDAGLARPEHALLRAWVLERYGEKLALSEVG